MATPLEVDSLDLVELLMSLNEELGFEWVEDDDHRCREIIDRWRETGELPPDWLNGAPVPRRGLPPTLPGTAEAPIPLDESSEEDDML